jgi:hypothetical protein
MIGQLNSSTPAVITGLKTKNTQFHTGIFMKHFGNSMNGFREGGRRVRDFFHWRDFAKKAKLQMKISKMKYFSRVSIARSQEKRRKFSLDFYIYFSK